MKVSAISDIHIKKPYDEADKLLMRFLHHPEVEKSDYILLLGDIFDLMCGPHDEYLEMYNHIFDRLDELSKKNKKIYFFEGNHDVHLGKLFSKKWKKNEIMLSQYPVIEEIEGKRYYFSHGDEHETDNLSYQRYKKFILTSPLAFIANQVMPFKLLNYIGEKASKRSRKVGAKIFNEDKVRDTFRKGVKETTEGKFDFVIGGHSHVQDKYKIENTFSVYVNNGYALNSKTFILIDNHGLRFEPLG